MKKNKIKKNGKSIFSKIYNCIQSLSHSTTQGFYFFNRDYNTSYRRIYILFIYFLLIYFFNSAQVAPGVLVLLIGFLGCDIVLVLIIWFIAVTLITASYAGAMASIVDIAPNLAGNLVFSKKLLSFLNSYLLYPH